MDVDKPETEASSDDKPEAQSHSVANLEAESSSADKPKGNEPSKCHGITPSGQFALI